MESECGQLDGKSMVYLCECGDCLKLVPKLCNSYSTALIVCKYFRNLNDLFNLVKIA